jgi:tmRNA-binding protein
MAEGVKIIALNRKARHDYSVDDSYECGIELLGTEVKSFHDGKISFPDRAGRSYLGRGMASFPASSGKPFFIGF